MPDPLNVGIGGVGGSVAVDEGVGAGIAEHGSDTELDVAADAGVAAPIRPNSAMQIEITTALSLLIFMALSLGWQC